MDQQEMKSENLNENVVKEGTGLPIKSGMATASLALGIISISISFIPIVNNATFVLGILALVFGTVMLVKKSAIGKSITGMILGVLSIVITLVMQVAILNAVNDAINDAVDEFNSDFDYMAGDKTDDILKNFLDVRIGDFQVIEDEYWDEAKLEVTLKNKSSEKTSFDITIEAVDSNGNRIDVDYIYVDDLGAGQSQRFEIFTYVTSDQYKAMKQATFKVVEVSMY